MASGGKRAGVGGSWISCAAVGSAKPRRVAGSSTEPVRNASATGPAGAGIAALNEASGRRSSAAARIAPKISTGGAVASGANSRNPTAPAASAAIMTAPGRPSAPRSRTGAPRRSSATAR